MAPLTRMRAERPSLAPRPLNAEYYAQRATPGGLIIAEATPVMPTGHGNPGVPGIYSERQITGWREVVEAVNPKGGVIFPHLCRVRPVPRFLFLPRGGLPGAPFPVPALAEFVGMDARGNPTTYQTRAALSASND